MKQTVGEVSSMPCTSVVKSGVLSYIRLNKPSNCIILFIIPPLCKYVFASTNEVSSIKARLKLCCHKITRHGKLVSVLHILYGMLLIIQLVTHLWLWSCRPLGSSTEVLLINGRCALYSKNLCDIFTC